MPLVGLDPSGAAALAQRLEAEATWLDRAATEIATLLGRASTFPDEGALAAIRESARWATHSSFDLKARAERLAVAERTSTRGARYDAFDRSSDGLGVNLRWIDPQILRRFDDGAATARRLLSSTRLDRADVRRTLRRLRRDPVAAAGFVNAIGPHGLTTWFERLDALDASTKNPPILARRMASVFASAEHATGVASLDPAIERHLLSHAGMRDLGRVLSDGRHTTSFVTSAAVAVLRDHSRQALSSDLDHRDVNQNLRLTVLGALQRDATAAADLLDRADAPWRELLRPEWSYSDGVLRRVAFDDHYRQQLDVTAAATLAIGLAGSAGVDALNRIVAARPAGEEISDPARLAVVGAVATQFGELDDNEATSAADFTGQLLRDESTRSVFMAETTRSLVRHIDRIVAADGEPGEPRVHELRAAMRRDLDLTRAALDRAGLDTAEQNRELASWMHRFIADPTPFAATTGPMAVSGLAASIVDNPNIQPLSNTHDDLGGAATLEHELSIMFVLRSKSTSPLASTAINRLVADVLAPSAPPR